MADESASTPLEIGITGGTVIETSRMPPDVLSAYNGALARGGRFADSGDIDSALQAWDEADEIGKPYIRKRKPIVDPTAPDPAPPELIPDDSTAIAVATSPDVCRSPDKAIPYIPWGKADDKSNYSPDVRSNGQVIKRQNSTFSRCYGDEPGVGRGVKSDTVGDIVEPVTSSPIVKANGIPVQRHSDKCTLNNGNCPGEYINVKSTDVHPAPDANDGEDKAWYDKAGEQAGSFWKGMTATSDTAAAGEGLFDKLGDWLNDPSQIGRDAQAAYDSLPTGSEIWQGTKNIAGGVAHVAGEVWNDPVGSAKATGGWVKDQGVGAWQGIEAGYEKHGIAGATGAVAGLAVEIVNPLKKLKMLERAAEAAEEIGDVEKARKLRQEAEKAREEARRAKKTETEGKDGTRSTRVHHVDCFEVPPGIDIAEYDRQLDEQMKTINNMTADDMAYAHWVLDKAGGTDALRQPYAQTQHRNEYKQMLKDKGWSDVDIKKHMQGLHATHFLDMVAGGNPTIFSRDAAGNPILGAGDANSHIGSSWTQKGRASSLAEEAERMRRSGRATEKMHVDLKRCK